LPGQDWKSSSKSHLLAQKLLVFPLKSVAFILLERKL